MKKLLLVLFVAFIGYSFTDVTKPNTYSPGDVIKASKLNQNDDTTYNRINNIYDSLEVNFVRFKDFKDSIIDTMKVKKNRSDTIISKVVNSDSVYSSKTINGKTLLSQGANLAFKTKFWSIADTNKRIFDTIIGSSCPNGILLISTYSTDYQVNGMGSINVSCYDTIKITSQSIYPIFTTDSANSAPPYIRIFQRGSLATPPVQIIIQSLRTTATNFAVMYLGEL